MTKIVSSNLLSVMQISTKKDASIRSRSVWKMTPAAFVKVCMFPNGAGRFLGDDICLEKQRLNLWGNPVEIIDPAIANECRVALVDPLSDAPEWHEFKEPLIPARDLLPSEPTQVLEFGAHGFSL